MRQITNKRVNKFLHLKPASQLALLVEYVYKDLSKNYNNWNNFRGKHFFVDRKKDNKKLLVVLAGYKEYLWDSIFGRIEKYKDDDLDVCICVCGTDSDRLKKIAKRNKWSYLSTKANKVPLAINIAVKKHPSATHIYKFDEDIFIGKSFFKDMYTAYKSIEKEGVFNPGMVVPMININGFSYIPFLKQIGKDKEYKKLFGELKSASESVKISEDPMAAIYIWNNSLPFDKVANLISTNNFSYLPVPHRFSIGAILFSRELFDDMGGFSVSIDGVSDGYDEVGINKYCFMNNRPILMAKNVFAGHIGFGHQAKEMKDYYYSHQDEFLKLK